MVKNSEKLKSGKSPVKIINIKTALSKRNVKSNIVRCLLFLQFNLVFSCYLSFKTYKMDYLIANVDNLLFKIERDLNEQFGALPLPFPGMDSKQNHILTQNFMNLILFNEFQNRRLRFAISSIAQMARNVTKE